MYFFIWNKKGQREKFTDLFFSYGTGNLKKKYNIDLKKYLFNEETYS